MTWGWFARRSARSPLAEESDAFLAGRYLERLLAMGAVTHVAPWMWLNAVAHADLGRVRELGQQPSADRRPTASWPDARMRVAREVLDECRDDPLELRRLQSTVLVPLELRILKRPGLTPDRLTEMTLNELRKAGAS